jgi:hypothetical protein
MWAPATAISDLALIVSKEGEVVECAEGRIQIGPADVYMADGCGLGMRPWRYTC